MEVDGERLEQHGADVVVPFEASAQAPRQAVALA